MGVLDYQGVLSDLTRAPANQHLWNPIEWNRKGNNFEMSLEPILFDIDCDYFSFKWRGRHYAWEDRFYDCEFPTKYSSYHTTTDWSVHKLISKLIDRAPFITIALENGCCGGKEEVTKILTNLNAHFFDEVIDVNSLGNDIRP